MPQLETNQLAEGRDSIERTNETATTLSLTDFSQADFANIKPNNTTEQQESLPDVTIIDMNPPINTRPPLKGRPDQPGPPADVPPDNPGPPNLEPPSNPGDTPPRVGPPAHPGEAPPSVGPPANPGETPPRVGPPANPGETPPEVAPVTRTGLQRRSLNKEDDANSKEKKAGTDSTSNKGNEASDKPQSIDESDNLETIELDKNIEKFRSFIDYSDRSLHTTAMAAEQLLVKDGLSDLARQNLNSYDTDRDAVVDSVAKLLLKENRTGVLAKVNLALVDPKSRETTVTELKSEGHHDLANQVEKLGQSIENINKVIDIKNTVANRVDNTIWARDFYSETLRDYSNSGNLSDNQKQLIEKEQSNIDRDLAKIAKEHKHHLGPKLPKIDEYISRDDIESRGYYPYQL